MLIKTLNVESPQRVVGMGCVCVCVLGGGGRLMVSHSGSLLSGGDAHTAWPHDLAKLSVHGIIGGVYNIPKHNRHR